MKSGAGGPGPNTWSDSTSNVWVDSAGLHLKITYAGGSWACAEVYSVTSTSYGDHRFYVVGRTDTFNSNVVLGLFTYQDLNNDGHIDVSNGDGEIDIELSQFSGEINPNNGIYVVQKYSPPGYNQKFNFTLTGTNSTAYSTYAFYWDPVYVYFRSFYGHYSSDVGAPGLNPPSSQWVYDSTIGAVPYDTGPKIHMNLWAYQGRDPGGAQEVVISGVDYP